MLKERGFRKKTPYIKSFAYLYIILLTFMQSFQQSLSERGTKNEFCSYKYFNYYRTYNFNDLGIYMKIITFHFSVTS